MSDAGVPHHAQRPAYTQYMPGAVPPCSTLRTLVPGASGAGSHFIPNDAM